MIVIRFTLTILLCALPLITGCKPSGFEVVSEIDEKQYQLAKDFQSQGRVAEALRAFLRVTEFRKNAPESHFEAGYIYLNAMDNPIKAIYHLEKYLELKPNSPQAARVRQLIETAEKTFARNLPAQPYKGELDRIEMMEMVNSLNKENNRLTNQNNRLTHENNRLRSLLSSSENPRQDTSQQNQSATISPNPASVPRTYTVQSGDSLSSISRTMYGTPSRWIDIYQANRDGLSSENALRVGQELRIP